MLGQINDALASLAGFAEPVGWITLGLFALAITLEAVDREYARTVYVGAWLVFSVFWLLLIQPFFVVDQSVIRGVGAVIAVPLSVLAAKVFYEGRDSLFTLSRAVALMGFIYVPVLMIPPLREQFILLVTNHTRAIIELLGYNPPVVTELSDLTAEQIPAGSNPDTTREISGKTDMYENTFVFFQGDATITYTIITDCTGIGSMAVVLGLVNAVSADWRRKLKASALAVGIIYAANLVRNVFISLSYGHQYAHFFPDLTMAVWGLDNPFRVSYIWADRIIAQSASVVAMILIIWLMIRIVPEVMEPIEDLLYLLTGEEYDLAGALDIDTEETQPDPAD
ncbi:archaeosortase A [Halovenus sp. WSH3]|uniref:Archaeosortase A n=1 Tax=Halovenus carboxidivorans TaxID=2692199 RepID=A0A6B0T631_9EURY|nr:archaeosortase A [Halovenus carboxidivorans]MXR50671.1 archaeosortase A [Halovenus carboxidivorans]